MQIQMKFWSCLNKIHMENIKIWNRNEHFLDIQEYKDICLLDQVYVPHYQVMQIICLCICVKLMDKEQKGTI